MNRVPVIMSTVLQDLPDRVRDALGGRVLARAGRAAGLDLELIRGQDCFIPHRAVVVFLDESAREAGDDGFALVLAPHMSVAKYRTWGDYVLGARTLGEAIDRAVEALPYHSSGDAFALVVDGDEARLEFAFALAGDEGYHHVAAAAAGVLVSLCRFYLPADWRPLRIELDIPRPPHAARFEDVFRCPVVFNAPSVAVVLERERPLVPRPAPAPRAVTIADVVRALSGSAPRDTPGIVAEHVRGQILGGSVSIENTARAMDLSVRSLQRELGHAGTDFRAIVNRVRRGRATELLRHSDASITSIAMDLGYSAPAHFARAFRNETGLTPRQFRAAEGRAG